MRALPRIIQGFAGAVVGFTFFSILVVPHVEPQAADPIVLGRQALDADRADEAIRIFEKAVAADPKDPAALAWLGSAQVRKAKEAPLLEKVGWVKRGFNTLDDAVELFSNAFIVYMVRGITASQVPDMFMKAPAAVKDLSTIIAMREKKPDAVPDSVMPTVYLHLGIAYKKNGQKAEARAAWEKGKTAYPSSPEAKTMEKELRSL
ncbi:MAG TPA: tetratricopeptide repeat protein [Methylomirabilota bacterium]|nr:tetratricopeptide repeat protein [Methylomirabilota bacterium]